MDPVVRARHPCLIPRSRSIERCGSYVGTLSRVTSVPNLSTLRVSDNLRHGPTLHKYRRDFDSLDDQFHDRIIYHSPFYWPTYRYMARRQAYVDPIPRTPGHELASFQSRFKWYNDWLNPTYWRRHRDPHYDQPLWNSWKPWQYDSKNVKRAIDMYRNGHISFDTLDKKWIEPNALGRASRDWNDVYVPAARYGAHRYFYQFER